MALTTYTAATDIIKTLGTNPEDRPTLTDDTFKAKFDENAANIAAFLNAMIAELASTANGKGASQIGIEDSGSKFTAATVEAALAEAATLISAHTAAVPYIAPTLLSGWVNFGAGFSSAGYMKDAHGFVHIKGLVKSGTTTYGTTIFVLPAGYRPLELEAFTVYSNDGSVVGAINIINAGDVILLSGGNASFSLSGITFKAA